MNALVRILALSDVVKWGWQEELVNKVEPDVVVLAGDLTSDGFARFWNEAVEMIPEFKKLKHELMRDRKVVQTAPNVYAGADSAIFESLHRLRHGFIDTDAFNRNRQKLHVRPFYRFLKHAGQRARVLVVKGDHDDDFPNDYSLKKINSIPGCLEISGSTTDANGLRLLGLGYDDTHYLTRLRPLLENNLGVDVVVTHPTQKRLPLLSQCAPRLIIRGHFGSGRFLVNGIPSVFTQGLSYATVEITKKSAPKIRPFVRDRDRPSVFKPSKAANAKPWFTLDSEYERYPWLQPYPK